MKSAVTTEKNFGVLIADGSTFIRIVLTTALESISFKVVGTAKDGKEAVDKYIALKPNIVLVDVELDGIDGIEVTRRLVNKDPSVVVIMLISDATDIPDIIVDAVRAGAKGYIKKPISAERIAEYIKSATKRR